MDQPPPPPPVSMTYRLSRVSVLQTAIVMAIFYALLALLFIPFFVILMLVGALQDEGIPQGTGPMIFMMIFMPIFYGFGGFVVGAIVAFFYNLVAKISGGLELTFSNPPAAANEGWRELT